MSLLLDARKKSQGGGNSPPESSLSLEPSAPATPASDAASLESARSASQNLFKAKATVSAGGQVNRNLIIALLGTVVLLGAGGAYVWYAISANDRPAMPSMPRAVVMSPPSKIEPPAPIPADPKSDRLVAAMATPSAPDKVPPVAFRMRKKSASLSAPLPASPSAGQSVKVSLDRTDTMNSLDTLLGNAYQAYLGGRFDQAQSLYREVLNQDPRNTDALLGLAAIAQHRGADTLAVQYYGKVLTIDPRNAVANAGMSALTTDENRESRLKMLLNEQSDSPSLYFALGNQFAEQSRWGEAQQAYFNAYKLEPNDAELAFNLAISLERLGQKKLSSQYYQRALKLDTGNSAGFDHATIEKRAQQLAQ